MPSGQASVTRAKQFYLCQKDCGEGLPTGLSCRPLCNHSILRAGQDRDIPSDCHFPTWPKASGRPCPLEGAASPPGRSDDTGSTGQFSPAQRACRCRGPAARAVPPAHQRRAPSSGCTGPAETESHAVHRPCTARSLPTTPLPGRHDAHSIEAYYRPGPTPSTTRPISLL